MTTKRNNPRTNRMIARFDGFARFLFALVSALLMSSACHGEEAAKSAEAADQSRCNFAASRPLLKPGVYKNYVFKKQANDQATESAQIGENLQLEIQSSGCVDSYFQQFTFSLQPVAGRKHSVKYWSHFVQRKLSDLKLNKDSTGTVKALIEFLARVPSYQLLGGKISICMDGSIADQDGCSWTTGGGFSFEVRHARSRTIIVVSRNQSM